MQGQQISPEIMRALIFAGADTQARDSEGRLPVEMISSENRQSREMYEEVVEEMDRLTLRPVLK
jgi:hypothetical protein